MLLPRRLPAFLLLAACASTTEPTPINGAAGAGGGGAAAGNGPAVAGSTTGGAGTAGAAATAGASAGAAGTAVGGAAGTPPSGSGPCSAPGLLVCDDFETLAAGAEPTGPNWLAQPAWQNDRIKADATHSHSGARSVSLVGATYGTQLIAAKGSPAPGNRFFVRVWLRLEKSTKEMLGHVAFVEGAEAEGDAGEELRLGASHGIVDLNLIPGSKGTGATGEKTQYSNGDVDVPSSGGAGIELGAGKWHCLEALFDGQAHEFRLWINDAEVPGLNVTDWKQGRKNWSPTYRFVKIGAQNFSGSTGRIWYDDLAIGTQRIGCPL